MNQIYEHGDFHRFIQIVLLTVNTSGLEHGKRLKLSISLQVALLVGAQICIVKIKFIINQI